MSSTNDKSESLMRRTNVSDEVWKHDVEVVSSNADSKSRVYTIINRFTYYERVNFLENMFEFIEFWPRLEPSGEIAWAVSVTTTTSSSKYRSNRLLFKELTAELIPTVATHNVITAVSDSTSMIEWIDKFSHQRSHYQIVTVIEPHKCSESTSLDWSETNQIVTSIHSLARKPPPVIAAALGSYKNDTIPLRADRLGIEGAPHIRLFVPSVDSVAPFASRLSPECADSLNRDFDGFTTCVTRKTQ